MINFPLSYHEILQRIDAVDPVAYAASRNFTTGAVSYLSPYISRDIVSLPQILDRVMSKGYTFSNAEKFIQELSWREYYQRVWQVKGNLIAADLRYPQTDVVHNQLVEAIVKAQTGIEAIDSAIQELYTTGYIHNHLRMYIASITCNIARADWRMPAKWLYYHLLDGDIASNNCSWQWVAGAFASKKYYCNQDNINQYTGTDQKDTLLDKDYEALPTSAIPDHLRSTTDLQLKTILPVTSMPVIDDAKPTLIYNSYNLDPQWRKSENVNRILLLEPSHFEKFPVSQNVLAFILGVSKNIKDIQVFRGGFEELQVLYKAKQQAQFIFKEHPAFLHYEGVQDERTWLFEEVKGYYPSFFNYWKRCAGILKHRY